MSKFRETLSGWYSNKHKWALIMLAICVVLVLCATLFGSMIQTAGWSASVEDLRNASNSGVKLITPSDWDEVKGTLGAQYADAEAYPYTVKGSVASGLLYVPKKASADNKRPAVVFTHGYLNNREMQLQNAIEMVRRGYVVLVIDYAQHGHNDTDVPNTNAYIAFLQSATMMNAAKYLFNLPYVDQTKIAVSGHSMGANASRMALRDDGVFESAIYLDSTNNNSPILVGTQNHATLLTGLHLGIISAGLMQGNEAPYTDATTVVAKVPAPTKDDPEATVVKSVSAYVTGGVGTNVVAAGLVKGSADDFFFRGNTKEPIYIPVHKDLVTEANYTNYYLKKGDDYVQQTSADRYRKNAQYYAYTSTSVACMYYLQTDKAFTFTRGVAPTDADDWTTVNGGIYSGTTLLAKPDSDKAFPANGKLVSVARKGEALASASQSIRVVYEAKETHPMNHMSTKTAGHVVDFFYNAFGNVEGVNYKAPTNQTWWLKETFAIFGFIGIFGMLIPLTDILLGTRLFASLKAKEGDIPEAPLLLKKPRKHVSYWLSAILTAWFGAWSFHNMHAGLNLIDKLGLGSYPTPGATAGMFTSSAANGYVFDHAASLAFWGILCAAFAIVVTSVIWLINHIINVFVHSEEFANYDERPFDGFKIRSWQNVLKTPILAVILVTIFYGTVFLIWNMATVDFRFWTFDLRVFDLERLPAMLQYVPLFFIFYMVNAALAKNYRVKDLPEWATIIINVAANTLGLLIFIGALNQYYINVGAMPSSINNLWAIAAVPIIPCVAFATVIARRLYVRTGNAWLAGLVNTLIITILTCANTSVSAPVLFYTMG